MEKLPAEACLAVLRRYADRVAPDPYVLVNIIVVALKMLDVESARKYSARLLSESTDSYGEHQQAAIWFFLRGHYDDAEKLWAKTAELREQAIEREGLHLRNLRLLGPSWLLAIGHIAHIDIYIKNKMIELSDDQMENFINFIALNDEALKNMSQYDLAIFIKDRCSYYNSILK